MPAIDRDQPLVPLVRALISANPGPVALAMAAVFSARLLDLADYAVDPVAITWATVLETGLQITAHIIATMTAVWAVISGGRPAGFAALGQIPAERLRGFIAYGILFGLWSIVFAAALVAIAAAIVPPDGIAGALAGGLAAALALMLVYVQLGFLFPDTIHSGQSGVLIAMILGIANGRKVLAAVIVPALFVTLPVAAVDLLAYDPATRRELGAMAPGLPPPDLALSLVLAALTTLGWVAYGIAVTRAYLDILPAARKPHGQFFS